MAINFNSFTEGSTAGGATPIQTNDYVVGFDTAVPGGERKWAITTLAQAVSSVMQTELNNKIATGPWILKTTTYTAVNNDRIAADTSTAAFTITLPASPSFGTNVTIVDAKGTWNTNNLTIARNGSTIEGLSQDLTCDVIGDMAITLLYNGSTWKVYV